MKHWHLVTRNCETCLQPLIAVLPGQARHPSERCDPGGGWWWDWDNDKPATHEENTE